MHPLDRRMWLRTGRVALPRSYLNLHTVLTGALLVYPSVEGRPIISTNQCGNLVPDVLACRGQVIVV